MQAIIELGKALQQMKSINGRAYNYYLARSKRAHRPKGYMATVNKLFLKGC